MLETRMEKIFGYKFILILFWYIPYCFVSSI